MMNALDVFGFILTIIGLVLTVLFGLISLGALWAVGALLVRDAKKAVVEFNSLLNWYVIATDGTRPYDSKEPNCLNRIYSCHWALVTQASEFMPEQMKADACAAAKKMTMGENISAEYSRLADKEPGKSPLLVWFSNLGISAPLAKIMPDSAAGRFVVLSLRLIAPRRPILVMSKTEPAPTVPQSV